MGKASIIEVKDVSVRYGDKFILENIGFEIYEGEIFVIVGGSGSGKTTLLRQIIGLEKPTVGTVFVEGEDFTNSIGEQRQNILRKFGVMFQSSGLFASMTVAENIALALETYTNLSEEGINDLIDLKLRSVGLEGCEHLIPAELSGGMKKRAALARAMTLDARILCIDEPSSGLDPVTAASLDNLINSINASLGTTIVVVSHDLASIFSIAHRVVLLDTDKKGIIAEGKPEDLKNDKENESVYKFFNRIS